MLLFSGAPKARIEELLDTVQLTVHGRKKESVHVRLLDEMMRSRSFFDDHEVTSLEFKMPSDGTALEVQFLKPPPGRYYFEVSTLGGTVECFYEARRPARCC
jgi:hypothetical protein